MFSIRPGTPNDNNEIYLCTLELLAYHKKQGTESQLQASGLLSLQSEGFLKSFVLLDGSLEAGNNVTGYAMYMDERDMLFGKQGFMLDQFFIKSRSRGKGQGRNLIKALCREAKRRSVRYIKLCFQESLQIEKFYAHFGFENITKSSPFLHLFEVYGWSEVVRCFKIDLEKPEKINNYFSIIHKMQNDQILIRSRSVQINEIPYTEFMISMTLTDNIECKNHDGQLILVVQIEADISIQKSMRLLKYAFRQIELSLDLTPTLIWTLIGALEKKKITKNFKIYSFVIKPTVCCWLGKMITFCDFIGDLEVVQEDVFKEYIRSYAIHWPKLMGVNFELSVPSWSCGKKPESYAPNHVLQLLRKLKIDDSFEHDGWNIALLDESRFEQIISAE